MKPIEIANRIEDTAIQLEQACAVLEEVHRYFENEKDAPWLPYHANHIFILLCVVSRIITPMAQGLESLGPAVLGRDTNDIPEGIAEAIQREERARTQP